MVAVSHSNQMVSQICSSLVLLEHGRVVVQGDPIWVIERYTGGRLGDGNLVRENDVYAEDIADPVEDSPVAIEDLEVLPDVFLPGDPLTFRFTLEVTAPTEGRLVMSFYSIGRAAFAEPEEGPSELLEQTGRWTITGQIASFPIAPGPYHLRVAAIAALDPDDFDQEFRQSLARSTVPFVIKGDATRRPGLKLDTRWEYVDPAHRDHEVTKS